jgi:hypothetical protein
MGAMLLHFTAARNRPAPAQRRSTFDQIVKAVPAAIYPTEEAAQSALLVRDGLAEHPAALKRPCSARSAG